jgi:hypothetical protein
MERLVQSALTRQLGQAERQPRVRDDVRAVVREPGRGEPLAQRIGLAGADAVPAMQVRQQDPPGRVLGVQVEREPGELGVELAPYLLGRDLAEPAERSDVIAPDQDGMLGHGGCQRAGHAAHSRSALARTHHRLQVEDRCAVDRSDDADRLQLRGVAGRHPAILRIPRASGEQVGLAP